MTTPDLSSAGLIDAVQRIAAALERLSPPPSLPADLLADPGYVWEGPEVGLSGIARIDHLPLATLIGIERQKQELLANLGGFASGRAANHMLLWGARGTGKSSLVKAAHMAVHDRTAGALALVEVLHDQLASLPDLLARLASAPRRFLLFCDDLSFDDGDTGYKSLKSMLDGGLRGCPDNVLLAVTSNRRHLLRRDMIENERSTAIHAGEAIEEKVSLADRFGLSLGFHNVAHDDYLAMVVGHLGVLGDALDPDAVATGAEEWARRRGSKSGRVAAQFARHIAAQFADV